VYIYVYTHQCVEVPRLQVLAEIDTIDHNEIAIIIDTS